MINDKNMVLRLYCEGNRCTCTLSFYGERKKKKEKSEVSQGSPFAMILNYFQSS